MWGKGRLREIRLHSVIRCLAVCTACSEQLQVDEDVFFILWRYDRNLPWFVRNCVRVKFGHRERDSLWGMVGMNWSCFVFCKPCNIFLLRLSLLPWILKQHVSAKHLYIYSKHQDSWKRNSVLRAWHIVMVPTVACWFSGTSATCLEAYHCKLQTEEFPVTITDYKATLFSNITVMASVLVIWLEMQRFGINFTPPAPNFHFAGFRRFYLFIFGFSPP